MSYLMNDENMFYDTKTICKNILISLGTLKQANIIHSTSSSWFAKVHFTTHHERDAEIQGNGRTLFLEVP